MKFKVICFRIMVLAMLGGLSSHLKAQSPDPRIMKALLYYNNSWELTSPEKSAFHREVEIDLENIVFHGSCKDFTKDGKLVAEGFYDHGANRGFHSEYFDNGLLESTIEYADDGFIIWEMTDIKNDHTVTQGTGKFILEYYYVVNGSQGLQLKEGFLTGEFLAGKRKGTWTYADKDGTPTDEETYDQGNFIQRVSLENGMRNVHQDKKSIIISLAWLLAESFSFDATEFTTLNQYFEKYLSNYPEGLNRPVAFPGGLKKLLLLVATEVHLEMDVMINAIITVTKQGALVKVKSEGVLFNWPFNDEVKRVLDMHVSKLLPAIRDGQPFDCTMKIPIYNSPEWIDYLQTAPDDDVNATVDNANVKKK